MLNAFSRSELLIGKDAIALLKGKKVAVFGVGGVGSYTVEALARTGLGHLTVCDDDKVCLTNVNRQLIATRSSVGRLKVDVMKDRILDINPEVEVETLPIFFDKESLGNIDFGAFDYVVDAIDTVTSKILLIEAAKAAGVPIISAMGAGNKIDPTQFEVTDIHKTSMCPLARVMRRELKKRQIKDVKVVYSKEEALKPIADDCNDCNKACICPSDVSRKCSDKRQIPGSLAFVPSVSGLIVASEVVKDLIEWKGQL